MSDDMTNAIAVRYYPRIDIDIDKTTLKPKRVDIDHSDSMTEDGYDYDTGKDVDFYAAHAREETDRVRLIEKAGEDVVEGLIPVIDAAIERFAAERGVDFRTTARRDGETGKEPFVLDRVENPHPAMLAKALYIRQRAEGARGDTGQTAALVRERWTSYLECMCDATGCSEVEINAWLDSKASQ